MSIHDLGLKPGQLRALNAKARHNGQTAPEYVKHLVERDLLASKSFDEILKPVREGFQRSGMTSEELDGLVTKSRRAIHAKRNRGRRLMGA
jgi:hypothetical protein